MKAARGTGVASSGAEVPDRFKGAAASRVAKLAKANHRLSNISRISVISPPLNWNRRAMVMVPAAF